MTSSTKRRLFDGIGAVLAAVAMSATFAVNPASASDGTLPAGITVPGEATGAPAVADRQPRGPQRADRGRPGRAGPGADRHPGRHADLLDQVARHRHPDRGAHPRRSGRRTGDAVVVPLFTTSTNSTGGFASGTVTVTDPTLLTEMRSHPADFYADLHTTAFPDGAARAQLHRLSHPVATSGIAAVQESVVLGDQIYACTAQPDGSFAFTQLNVEARLTGGIHHTSCSRPPVPRNGRHQTAARSPARSSTGTPTGPATSPNWTSTPPDRRLDRPARARR